MCPLVMFCLEAVRKKCHLIQGRLSQSWLRVNSGWGVGVVNINRGLVVHNIGSSHRVTSSS